MNDQNVADVYICAMSRDMCHEFYKHFQNDPAIGHYYDFAYSPAWTDAYFDRNTTSERILFAIMAADAIVGEIKLKDIDRNRKTCSFGIHLQNDSVKGMGYGTKAERLILRYVFDELDMRTLYAEAALQNHRSQHVLEKVGLSLIREDETFKYYCITKAQYQNREESQ